MAKVIPTYDMAFVLGDERIAIEDSEVTSFEDHALYELTVAIGAKDAAALLDALLEAEGMEKRWANEQSAPRRLPSYNVANDQAEAETWAAVANEEGDGWSYRPELIYVPKETADG